MTNVIFVSGIDTGIGKSYATGFLAREWNSCGIRTITQKLVQTGNPDVSEDIELHRTMMQTGWLPDDESRLTMPEVFTYPCSPHLAAEIDSRSIDFTRIDHATSVLAQRYDRVLLEGAGGLMVPLTRDMLTIDFVQQRRYPVILVTSGRLGSINHTLLSLEALEHRDIRLMALVYNCVDDHDLIISRDTKAYLRNLTEKRYPEAEFIELPVIDTV